LADRRKGRQVDGATVDAVIELAWTMPARSVSSHAIQRLIVRDGEAMLQALLHQAGPHALVKISLRIAHQADQGRGVGSAATVAALPVPERAAHQSFAQWLSAALEEHQLTQEAAALQLGVSVRTVGRWITGATQPGLQHLRRIEEAFGSPPAPAPAPVKPLGVPPLSRPPAAGRRSRRAPAG
jgi:DNA-binding XRE family transcriptional regulator